MSLLTLLLWVLGGLFFLVITGGAFAIWGLPRIKEWLKEKYSPTLKRCFLEIREGNNWPGYYGKLIHDTPVAMTYEYEIKIAGKTETREVTIKNTEPVEWKEGCRAIVMEAGGTIGHSPSTENVDPIPEGLYNMHREAYIKTQYNMSVTANKGIDIKLVIIVGMFLVVIVAAVAMSGVFKKPPVNNIYTSNQTATQNYTPPVPVITGQVVP